MSFQCNNLIFFLLLLFYKDNNDINVYYYNNRWSENNTHNNLHQKNVKSKLFGDASHALYFIYLFMEHIIMKAALSISKMTSQVVIS
jgi:hypothetical protein